VLVARSRRNKANSCSRDKRRYHVSNRRSNRRFHMYTCEKEQAHYARPVRVGFLALDSRFEAICG
jgi:hypothetical protein